ncbi:related to ABC transporter [Fusarium proliferatum]|nr:related to ABC transporter [Fusarium proliferatum]
MLEPYSVDFTRASVAAAKLFDLIDRESEIDSFDSTGKIPSETIGEISVDNATFAYPTRPGIAVLDDYSVKFPAGKTTALVVSSKRRQYGMQQEPVLFQGTIFDNIRSGLTGTTWEDAPVEEQMHHVEEAAKLAFAHEFISKLPNGYNTQVGEHGCLLSGGQKQRIAIARSIISKPKVLLLDEATSALDPEAEGIVQKALDTVSKGRTTIFIAHKLASIQKADNIIVMMKGRIVEQGTHQFLTMCGGTYARLVQIQNLAAQSDESGGITDQSEPLDHVPMSIEPSRTLTRHETSHQSDIDGSKDLGGYEQHEQRGVISVIIRIVGQTPELRLAFIVILMACIVAGATFPGLAILIANIVEVFSLTGSEIELQGNFYAKMFIVFACRCFVAYFALGYATYVVAHNLSHKFRKSILESILRQDLQFFDREENTTGVLISQIDSNPQAVLELMGYNVGFILVAVFNITACSVLAIVRRGSFFSGQSAAQLFQYSTSVTKSINAANYIFWLQDLQPSVRETDENRGNGPESGDTVNILDVHFSYPLRPEMRILRGINVNIKKGQFVAFVGASGCGKSTIIALLERFYDPTTGSIDIDSTCLTSLNPRLYRRIVGLVQQEPALLQGSIRENIALGVDEPSDDTISSSATGTVSDKEIESALRAANGWDFVSSLPEVFLPLLVLINPAVWWLAATHCYCPYTYTRSESAAS